MSPGASRDELRLFFFFGFSTWISKSSKTYCEHSLFGNKKPEQKQEAKKRKACVSATVIHRFEHFFQRDVAFVFIHFLSCAWNELLNE